MTEPSKAYYECCHEAGHALLRFLRGDTLLSIRVDIHPDGDEAIPVLDREALRIAELKNANVLVGDMYVTMLPKLTPQGPEALSL